MEPRVMAHSQAHRLRERMAEAAIGHGQEVRADLPGIRVTAEVADWRSAPDPKVGTVYFCTMGSIRVHQVLAVGDAQPLPSEVILEGLALPEPGTYDILNALVRSNGALRITADAGTRVVQRSRSYASGWV
jgi:hypothetical protein